MGIKYPKEKGVLAEFSIGDGHTSPFNIKHIKKTADKVKQANIAMKKRKSERFVLQPK